MSTSFRSEVFSLCQKLAGSKQAHEISRVIHDLSVSPEEDVLRSLTKGKHGDFAYVAKQSDTEFQAYLFLDDNLDRVSLPDCFRVEHLLTSERILIENGHATLVEFVKECLSDISNECEIAGRMMEPYSLHKDVEISGSAKSLLTRNALQGAVKAFKETPAYISFISSNILEVFKQAATETVLDLFSALDNSMQLCLKARIPNDIKDFSHRLALRTYESEDAFFAPTLLMFSLRQSLKTAIHLMFRAICGVNLFVLNENNIIKIESQSSDATCDRYRVLAQGVEFDTAGNSAGDVLLCDFSFNNGKHIHEFGFVVSETVSFSKECGETSKFSFVGLDDSLNLLRPLIQQIIQANLPPIKELE